MRKKDDVRKYVVRREIKKKDKTFFKSPKIQRLITEKRIRRKKLNKVEKKEGFKAKREARAKYDKVLSQYIKERKALHAKKDEKPVVEEKKAPVEVKSAPAGKGVKTAAPVKKAEIKKDAPKVVPAKKQEAPKKDDAKKAQPAKKGGK